MNYDETCKRKSSCFGELGIEIPLITMYAAVLKVFCSGHVTEVSLIDSIIFEFNLFRLFVIVAAVNFDTNIVSHS